MTAVPLWLRFIVFAIFLAAIVAWIGASDESFTGSPGRQGDDVYFENIAYHLAKGEGIKFDFRDEAWRRPYRESNRAGENDWIFFLTTRGLTTSRSPGFPMLVAGVYQVAGRNWVAVRVVVAVLLAAGLTLLIGILAKLYGWLVASIALVTLALDFFVLRTAGQFMTEGLGTVVICVLFWGIMQMTQRSAEQPLWRQLLGWFGVGLVYGIGILVRANLNAWLIVAIAALAGMVVYRLWRGWSVRWLLGPAVVFCLGVLVTAGPWWVRNCIVTKEFCPFGTSGSFGIAGGYSTGAYANGGNWDPNVVHASQQQTLLRAGILQLPLPQQEYWMGRDSSRLAWNWILENRDKLPLLMLKKGYSHLGFYRQPLPLVCINGLMIIGAVIGCWVSRKSLGTWIAIIVGLSLVTTMLTWPHYGRYSIPIRPLIHVASAIGTVAFWKCVLGMLRDKVNRGAKSRSGRETRFKNETLLVLLLAFFGACRREEVPKGVSPIVVFAAVSTSDVIREGGKQFEAKKGVPVTFSFDSSSNLAKQIKAGAPADVFLSADEAWMDDVAKAGVIRPESRIDLLGNSLVLIAPADRKFEVEIDRRFDFSTRLPEVERIAIGDPSHVPAGRYARQALDALGWWKPLESRMIPSVDVRAALRMVEMGEADAGIVYATDAKHSDKVAVVGEFPNELHEPIRYPIALCSESHSAAEFVEFLNSPEMGAVFRDAGFRVLSTVGER